MAESESAVAAPCAGACAAGTPGCICGVAALFQQRWAQVQGPEMEGKEGAGTRS